MRSHSRQEKTRHLLRPVRQKLFEIDLRLNPKFTQPGAYDWHLAGRF
jgi:hypothetical protein